MCQKTRQTAATKQKGMLYGDASVSGTTSSGDFEIVESSGRRARMFRWFDKLALNNIGGALFDHADHVCF
jgi:glycine cleavage system aminomethyltransferase T